MKGTIYSGVCTIYPMVNAVAGCCNYLCCPHVPMLAEARPTMHLHSSSKPASRCSKFLHSYYWAAVTALHITTAHSCRTNCSESILISHPYKSTLPKVTYPSNERDPVKPGTRNNRIRNNGIIIAHAQRILRSSRGVCCFHLLLLSPDSKRLM